MLNLRKNLAILRFVRYNIKVKFYKEKEEC